MGTFLVVNGKPTKNRTPKKRLLKSVGDGLYFGLPHQCEDHQSIEEYKRI